METSVKSSVRRRERKKKQKAKNLLKRCGESPSRKLGITKQPTRKQKRIKQITRECIHSVIEDLYNQQILLEPDLETYKIVTSNPEEHVIDLCDADSSMENANSSVLVLPSKSIPPPENEIVIDLSKEIPDKDEVIDLTEPTRPPVGGCSEIGNHQPTVIDITEEELKEKQNCTLENDEICVIGTYNKCPNQNNNSSFIPLQNTKNNFNNLINCSKKLKKKYLMKKSVLDKIGNKSASQCSKDILRKKSPVKVTRIGENICVNSPVTFPSSGLRPIIIDGSNVAFVHSKSNFSCKRLEICINYFKEKGHKVIAFVPQFRLNSNRSDNPQLLRKLEKQGDVVLTPSKKVDGRNIVPYDDRFIVQTAVLKGGIIISRDNYNDLLKENPAWGETIKYRTLAFTWVDDVLMFPKDPLGEFGPSLEEFLRFH